MRVYYECTEIVAESSTTEPDFIRIDITEKSEDERLEILSAIRDQFKNKKYQLVIHYCHHDENKPCMFKTIEVIS